MRREPIPDAVLWQIVKYADGGGYDPNAELARELLALREAARCVFECMSGSWAEVDPKTLNVLREALPPMQPKEPDHA